MSTISELNFAGQTVLAGAASVATNSIVHPLSTIRSRIQAQPQLTIIEAVKRGSLYAGFRPVCVVDFASFGVAYLVNDWLQERMSPLPAAMAAGALSAPVEAFGEAFVNNQQVHALPLRAIVERALRPSGAAATIARQIPFITAVFYLAPHLQEWMDGKANPLVVQAAAGGMSGAMAGALTGPVDLIKTRVQTREEYLSIRAAIQEVWREGGMSALCRGSGVRSMYIGLAVSVMNVVNNALPHIFPNILRNKN